MEIRATGNSVLQIFEQATERFAMLMRARHRVLWVVHTIAAIAGKDIIGDEHIAEALALLGLN